jgi:transcriptional regulator with GAF, ATPase, and Fis domain
LRFLPLHDWLRSQESVLDPKIPLRHEAIGSIRDTVEPRALQSIALAVAEARSVDLVLQRIIDGLAGQPEIALARIWLIAPGDICASSCLVRAECPDQTRCLHLLASAGRSNHDSGGDWSRLTGDFRRIPLNVWKVGRIGGTGTPILITDDLATDPAIDRPEWAKAEGIVAFAGQPLIFKGETLGVLAVFSRAHIGQGQFEWVRTFADHAAVALANARAFEELARLRQQVELERDHLREEVREVLAFGDIVGESPALQGVLRQVERVAPTGASVLLLGESGTGKELVASAIHDRSSRRHQAFVRVNCASVHAELFESEFFGHVKGAFTGAVRDRVGRFQLADRGTLFLDEVGEIPPTLQAKLLRVLQEGQFERVGEEQTRRVDVRIIAATNRVLEREVEAGRFREDLYYRLSLFPIELPPLRDRKEDIAILASHFLRLASQRLNRPAPRLSAIDLRALEQYDWPGNVRELAHVIERAVILTDGRRLQLDEALTLVRPRPAHDASVPVPGSPSPLLTDAEVRRLERENIQQAIARAGGKIYGRGGAAGLLGLKPTTLAYRMKALGIPRPPS